MVKGSPYLRVRSATFFSVERGPLVPIKDTSSILTKGKHNSPRILVARSPAGRAREKNERKEEEREKEEGWKRGRRREIVSKREKRLG